MSAKIVVSVGTDHHPFHRLIQWTEDWVASHDFAVDLFVQHGESSPPTLGRSAPIVSRDQMLDEYRSATVVVTQGGPGGILDVAEMGKIPIVVPRDPAFGEHVDGHQIAFTRFLADSGEIVLAEDYAAFDSALTRAMEEPAAFTTLPRVSAVDETARALERVVDDVLSRPAGFVRWSRLRPRRSQAPVA